MSSVTRSATCGPETYDLSRATWTVTDLTTGASYPAQVPGTVHNDLINAGAIPDPFFRENEAEVAWIGEHDWRYTGSFEVAASFLTRSHQRLRFEGLDTLARVTLNGREVLVAENMHRTWELDVAGLLREGSNELEVTFASAVLEVRRRQQERHLPGWYDMVCEPGIAHLRKQLSHFGWDWGPAMVTAGVWRDACLVGYDDVRILDVQVLQAHTDARVVLDVRPELAAPLPEGFSVRVEVRDPAGADVGTTVVSPQLWWPRGLGEQPLYTVTTAVLDAAGAVVDALSCRVGLRTLGLVREPDDAGESFAFRCNGVTFFAKGANWIPFDAVLGRTTDEQIRARVADAAAAHMNMLRVWGGGIYESDAFYDACDELGICVWQDVLFACANFPGDDHTYLDNVRAEVADNARRLRNHASLALWCGNNELEMGLVGDDWTKGHMSWAAYEPLMDEILPSVLTEVDPGRDYWPASPHSPHNRRDADDPSNGDAHLWQVWHGGEHPHWYRTSRHRFISEFGFQSFPHPLTVESFTEPGDRNLASSVMDSHQKAQAAGASGSAELARQLVQFFRSPRDWESLVWQTQFLQAGAVITGIEHWRRNMPVTMGTLYWQLNDCWPGPSWSSIDSTGRWKALHHAVRRAYAPVMLSLLEDATTGTVGVHVCSDRLEETDVEVHWSITTCEGEVVDGGTASLRLGAQSVGLVTTVDAQAARERYGDRDVLVWAELAGSPEQSAVATFVPVKHLNLGDPCLRVEVQGSEVTLAAERPALWVSVDADGASDNFLHMPAGKRVVTVPDADAHLVVRSLFDTY